MRGLLTAAFVIGSTAFAGPPLDARQEAPAVSIDVVAVDRQGQPVADLGPDDFEVRIGQFRVPIRSFRFVSPASERRPERLIVLLLDDVTLSPAVAPRAREVARQFVTRMSPGDRMAIVMLSGVSAELTDDPVRLRRTIDSYNVRASAFARLDVLSEQILDTLATVSREVREAAPGRKAIVAIGPGAIFDRPLPLPGMGRDLAPQWTDTMRSLAMAHAHLYVIDPSGVGATLADSGEHGFARETGGRAFLSTNDTTDAVDRILRDAANYYVIGVSDPPVGRKSELRKLDVRVSRRGVTVLARRAIPGGS